MAAITTSETVRPPAHPFYGDSWVRGVDPFHPNAFQGFSDDIVDQIRSINPGPQKGGWFLLDAYGQEIGFVPDGTIFEPTPKSETSTDSTPHQNPKSDTLVECPTDSD